jgi:hypothetical protein
MLNNWYRFSFLNMKKTVKRCLKTCAPCHLSFHVDLKLWPHSLLWLWQLCGFWVRDFCSVFENDELVFHIQSPAPRANCAGVDRKAPTTSGLRTNTFGLISYMHAVRVD